MHHRRLDGSGTGVAGSAAVSLTQKEIGKTASAIAAPASAKDKESIDEVKEMNIPYVVVLITGRPLIVNETINNSNAFLVAWLPGTEGGGVADVLFGDKNLQGRLSFSWPKDMEDIPCNYDNNCAPLFPLGFGLSYSK